jgi:hypothetical protein
MKNGQNWAFARSLGPVLGGLLAQFAACSAGIAKTTKKDPTLEKSRLPYKNLIKFLNGKRLFSKARPTIDRSNRL